MARLLINCLERASFQVKVASPLRAFLRDPDSETDKALLIEQADLEIQRLSKKWEKHGAPQLWFCYHPYYKSPDLIGPQMCKRFNIPYVTAEASYSKRRSQGIWAPVQEFVLETVNQAAVNICFTERDRVGLCSAAPEACVAKMPPFIDISDFESKASCRDPSRLVTVAMMRAGDKMNSYTRLAAALKRLLHLPWTLSIVGEGPRRSEVFKLFSELPQERLEWHGLLNQTDIATLFARSSLYVWPGCGEAYGLAYLEAQAAGVPVVAFNTAGVPEVVDHGNTGLLTPEGDDELFAAAISMLLGNAQFLKTLSDNAVLRVRKHHSLAPASAALQRILQQHVGA